MASSTCQVNAILDRLRTVSASPPKTYPSVSSIPRTPSSRLADAAESGPAPPSSNTVLYLAYGSNLCAETFLGVRGIRPLSQVNVSAPSLRLVFDLPGMPYTEPCFANTAPRKIPKPPLPTDPPIVQPPPQMGWDKGLIGVVYEVTPEDYAHIIATEGGGAGYHDILVPCLELPPRMSVPEKPPVPELPKPFLAHTLYAPNIPDAPEDEPDNPDVPDPRKKWYYRFITRPHREEGYAQPSARYLKLITDGAAEHELPDDYQAYLKGLQPYIVTNWRQEIGRALLGLVFGPFIMVWVGLGKLLTDDKGHRPAWTAIVMVVFFNLTWMTYDSVFKRLFGDGERTEEDKNAWRNTARRRKVGSDEEKVMLMSG